MHTTQNYNAYYKKLQCVLHQTTGILHIVLHKIIIVLFYTTLQNVPFFTPTVCSVELTLMIRLCV